MAFPEICYMSICMAKWLAVRVPEDAQSFWSVFCDQIFQVFVDTLGIKVLPNYDKCVGLRNHEN